MINREGEKPKNMGRVGGLITIGEERGEVKTHPIILKWSGMGVLRCI